MHYPKNYPENENLIEDNKKTVNNDSYSKLIISLLFVIYYHFSKENSLYKFYSIIFYFLNSKLINFIIYLIQTFEFKLIEHIVGIDNIRQNFNKHNQTQYYLNLYLKTQDVFLYIHILFVNIYYSSSISFYSSFLLIFPFFVIIINILLIVICLFKRREIIFINNLKIILLIISLIWIYVNFSIILYSIAISYVIHNSSNWSDLFIKYICSLNLFYLQHLVFGIFIYYFYWKVIYLLYEKDLLLKIRQEKIVFLSEIHYSSGINYVSFQYENYEIRNISEIFEFYMKNGGNISRKDNDFLNNEYQDFSKENIKKASNSFYLNTLKESHIIDDYFKFSPENFIKIENNTFLFSNKTKKSSTINNLVVTTLKESIELFIKDNINDNSFLSNDYQVLGFYINTKIKQLINSNIIGNSGVITNHKMRKENLTFSNNTFGTKSSPRLKKYLEYKYDLMINSENFYSCLSNISTNKDVYLIYAKTKKTNQSLYDKQTMFISKNKSFLDYVEMIFIKINPYPIYIPSNYYNQKTNNLLNKKNNENLNNIFIQNIVENDSFNNDNNHNNTFMKNTKRLSKFSVVTSDDDSFKKYKEKDCFGKTKKKNKIFEKVKITETKGLSAQLLNSNNSLHKNEIKNNKENKENLFDSLLELSSSFSNEKNISELLIGKRSNTFHFKKINYENFYFNSNEKQRQRIKITSSLSKKNNSIKGLRKNSKYKIITKKKISSKTSKGLLYFKNFEEDVNRLYIKKDYVDNFPLKEINENMISIRKSKLKEIEFLNKSKNRDNNNNIMLNTKEYTSKTKKLYEYTNILISKLSHEIKTSLISIKVISEKLVEKYIENYDIYKSFKKISSLSNIIIFLVYDLSDFLQNKTSPISFSSFTLGEFKESIKDLCEAYMMLFNKENTVDIIYSIEEELILSNITSDEKKLKQIILNLLSNSIKNTIKGKIKMEIKRNRQTRQNKYFQLNSSNLKNIKNNKSICENSLFIEISDEAGGVPKEYFNYINIIYNDSIYNKELNFLQRNSYSYKSKKLPSFSRKYSSKSGLGNGFILSKKLAKELGIILTCEYIYESSVNKYNSYNNISLPNESINKKLNKKIIGTRFILQLNIENDLNSKQIGNINLINSINSSQSNKNLGFYSFNPNNNLLESVKCVSEIRVENKNTSSFFNIQTSKLSENEDIQYDYNFNKSKKDVNDNNQLFSMNEDNKSNSSKTVSNHSFIVEFDYFKNKQFAQFSDEVEEIKSKLRVEDSENDDEDEFKTPLELLNNLKFYSSNNNNFNSNKTNKENETSNATKIPISDKNIISNKLLIVKDNNKRNRIERRIINNNVSIDDINSYNIEINSKILPKQEGKVNEIATIMNFTSSLNNTHIEYKERLLNINKISSFNKKNKHMSDTSTMNILKINNNAFASKCRIVENRKLNNKSNSTMNLTRCNINININDGLNNEICIENNTNTNNIIQSQKVEKYDNIYNVSNNNYFNYNKESHKLHLSFQGVNHDCLYSPCLDNKGENIYIRKPTNISSLEVSLNDSVKYESGKNIPQLKFLSPVSIISEIKMKQRTGILKSSLEVIKDEEIESNKNEKYEYICILVDDKADIVNSECRLLTKNIEEKLGKDMKEKWKFLKLKDGFELINSVYYDLSSKSNKIKLVLCDEMMDFMNGSEALGIIDKLYEKVNARKFPFFFISAFTNNDFFYQVQRKDWKIEFLEKPLNSKAAGNLVDKYFNI